eukprot:1196251-Amphidinium_carterae.1
MPHANSLLQPHQNPLPDTILQNTPFDQGNTIETSAPLDSSPSTKAPLDPTARFTPASLGLVGDSCDNVVKAIKIRDIVFFCKRLNSGSCTKASKLYLQYDCCNTIVAMNS